MVAARILIVLVIALCSTAPLQAAVEFDVTPTPIAANESCRLTYKVIGAVDAEPDFSALDGLFEIIGRNRQASLNWVNGRREQSTTWTLSAIARETGKHIIPAISFGRERSEPREIEVIAVAQNDSPSGADIIVEVEVDTTSPYVQQQVIYTVRLFHRIELSSPRFSAPEASTEAIIKPLNDGRQYIQTINGTNYEAFESRYAVFPQRSGPLTLRPLVLTTQVITRTRSYFDPFSPALQTRRVESEALELDIRPVPANFPSGAAWLPAKRIRLHEEWVPDATTAEVGSPLSRTIFLWADGLIARHLPELKLDAPAGSKIYPDQVQSNDKDTASGFTTVVQQKFALIAGTPGSTEFAPLSIPWWNTDTDELETATLPARRMEFFAGQNNAPLPAPIGDGSSSASNSDEIRAGARSSLGDRAVAGFLAIGWLVTILAWLRSARRGEPLGLPKKDSGASADKARRPEPDLRSACASNNAAAAARALRAWATTRAGVGAVPAKSLRQALLAANSPELRHQIAQLERALYGNSVETWRGAPLLEAFGREPAAADQVTADESTPLPRLFRLATR